MRDVAAGARRAARASTPRSSGPGSPTCGDAAHRHAVEGLSASASASPLALVGDPPVAPPRRADRRPRSGAERRDAAPDPRARARRTPCSSRATRSPRSRRSATASSSCTAAACSPPTRRRALAARLRARLARRRRGDGAGRRRSPRRSRAVPGVRARRASLARERRRTRAAASRSSPGATSAPALAARVAAHGWGLLALAPVETSLEEAFLAPGRGDATPARCGRRSSSAGASSARCAAGRSPGCSAPCSCCSRGYFFYSDLAFFVLFGGGEPGAGPLALRLPRLPAGRAPRAAAAHHAALRRGAEARHARAALDASRSATASCSPGSSSPRSSSTSSCSPATRVGPADPLRAAPVRAGPVRRRATPGMRAPRHGLHRLRPRRLGRHREPGGERDAHLRRARLLLVRHLERGGDRRAHRPAPPPAVALRPLLRLRAGRDRQPRRRLPRSRSRRSSSSWRSARSARAPGGASDEPPARSSSPSRSSAVTAILGCLVALAALHPWRLDLTPERRFTLSPHTREVLARLDDDVHVTVFYSSQEGAIRREMADLLALYHDAQPRIDGPPARPRPEPGRGASASASARTTRRSSKPASAASRSTLVNEENVTAALLAVAGTPPVVDLLRRRARRARPARRRRARAARRRRRARSPPRASACASSRAPPRSPADAGLVVLAGPTRDLAPPEVDALAALPRRRRPRCSSSPIPATPRAGRRAARALRHRARRRPRRRRAGPPLRHRRPLGARRLPEPGARPGRARGAGASCPRRSRCGSSTRRASRADYLAMTAETTWADVDRRPATAARRPSARAATVAARCRSRRFAAVGTGPDAREGRLVVIGDADFVTNLYAERARQPRPPPRRPRASSARAAAAGARRGRRRHPGGTFSPLDAHRRARRGSSSGAPWSRRRVLLAAGARSSWRAGGAWRERRERPRHGAPRRSSWRCSSATSGSSRCARAPAPSATGRRARTRRRSSTRPRRVSRASSSKAPRARLTAVRRDGGWVDAARTAVAARRGHRTCSRRSARLRPVMVVDPDPAEPADYGLGTTPRLGSVSRAPTATRSSRLEVGERNPAWTGIYARRRRAARGAPRRRASSAGSSSKLPRRARRAVSLDNTNRKRANQTRSPRRTNDHDAFRVSPPCGSSCSAARRRTPRRAAAARTSRGRSTRTTGRRARTCCPSRC